MHRAAAAAALTLTVAAALSACAGSSAPATTTPATSTPAAATPTGLQSACSSYESAHVTARQVAASAAHPIVASGPALFLINLRQTASNAVSTVPPESAPAFAELRDAIDDLNNQATAALPPGADGTKTLVTVNPARLSAALDAVDKVCAPR